MIIPAVAAFFKYKIVSSIIVLTCRNEFDLYSKHCCNYGSLELGTNADVRYYGGWMLCCEEQMRLVRQLSLQGMRATASCDPGVLNDEISSLQGVLYISRVNETLLDQTRRQHFSIWYKWLIIGDEIPPRLNHLIRYDADIALLDPRHAEDGVIYRKGQINAYEAIHDTSSTYRELFFEDVYIHLRDGASRHPLAVWTQAGFQPLYESDRIKRRLNLKRYPMRIATPMGHYDKPQYDGKFSEYIVDNSQPERDSAIRCGYGTSSLILEWLNAKEVLTPVEHWALEVGNNSMYTRLVDGTSELSGGILRVQTKRLAKLDYVIPLWYFKVGFTYVAERESSSNMFVMPFTSMTWVACAAITVVLALAQRATAKAAEEKEGAFVAVIATWLQQDASAVPAGASGRLTFIALSVCSMLVYAYYSSAIVSALMSAGSGGPTTLRALGDSKYRIASEDYDYIRAQMFNTFRPDWPDMEYLKRKKLQSTANFYMDPAAGMKLVKSGSTAYHAEYNHVYPLMRILSDDQLCKLQYVYTIPPVMTWLITTKRGQWTDILRTGGHWLHETGLAKRMVSRWQIKPPPCRAALLAERVSYGDVSPLIILTFAGFVASVIVLVLEVLIVKCQNKKAKSFSSTVSREEQVID